MSFEMVFEATNKAVTYDGKAKRFRVTGCSRDLSDGGTRGCAVNRIYLEKRPNQCPSAEFAVIGDEVNGSIMTTIPRANFPKSE